MLRFGADRVDAGIRTTALCQIHDALVDIFLHEIDGFSACFACERQALGDRIDRQHAAGAQQKRASDRELADRAAPPYRNRFTSFEGSEISSHVSGGKDVRKEQDLIIAETIWNLDGTHISIRYPQILRLAAGVAA